MFKILSLPLLLPLLLVLLFPALNGCSTTGTAPSANAAVLEQTAVTVAVGELVLSQKTPAAQKSTAADIVSVATAVQQVVNGNAVTSIASLQAVVQAAIVKLNLNQQEQLLANVLVSTLVMELNGKVSLGTLNAADLVVVNQLLGWVVTAATPYASA